MTFGSFRDLPSIALDDGSNTVASNQQMGSSVN